MRVIAMAVDVNYGLDILGCIETNLKMSGTIFGNVVIIKVQVYPGSMF